MADACDATRIGTIRADITSDLIAASTGEFTDGTWAVRSGADAVVVTAVSGADVGVDLSLNGGSPEFFGWPEFAGLFAADSTVPAWQQAASASFQLLRLTLSQVEMTFAALVDAKEASFTSVSLVKSCSRFPTSPPTGRATMSSTPAARTRCVAGSR